MPYFKQSQKINLKIWHVQKSPRTFAQGCIKIIDKFTASFNAIPDSKDHVATMGPTCVLSTPDGPHVGPMDLLSGRYSTKTNYGMKDNKQDKNSYCCVYNKWLPKQKCFVKSYIW